jgi:hypothetical protein
MEMMIRSHKKYYIHFLKDVTALWISMVYNETLNCKGDYSSGFLFYLSSEKVSFKVILLLSLKITASTVSPAL